MLHIGCHISSSKGFLNIGKEALSIGADTFQFFTRNPRGGKAKKWDLEDAAALNKLLSDNNFAPILAHAPYTLNPCSKKPETVEFARMVFSEDLNNLQVLNGAMYNFHPGSHVGQGVQKGIEMISSMLNESLFPQMKTTVLLETMAGKGSEVGSKFEELKAIIDNVTLKEKIGVCIDTCHIFDAGYDIVGDLYKVLNEFDRVIGISNLYAVHLNDSKNEFASHKDRHEKIGKGSIGIEAFTEIINSDYLRDLPFYLETPNELEGYAEEIALLRSLYKE